jgi:hypothetical protein
MEKEMLALVKLKERDDKFSKFGYYLPRKPNTNEPLTLVHLRSGLTSVLGQPNHPMHKQPLSLMIGILNGSTHYQSKFQGVSLHTIPTTIEREGFVHKQHP